MVYARYCRKSSTCADGRDREHVEPNLRHVLNLVILVRDVEHSSQALKASVNHRWACVISCALACKFSRRICGDSAGRYAWIIGFESKEVVKLFQPSLVVPLLLQLGPIQVHE